MGSKYLRKKFCVKKAGKRRLPAQTAAIIAIIAALVVPAGCGLKKSKEEVTLSDDYLEVTIAPVVKKDSYEKDGVLYKSEETDMLKISWPVAEMEFSGEELIGSYPRIYAGGEGIKTTVYYVSGTRAVKMFYTGLPNIYDIDGVESVEYTVYNVSGQITDREELREVSDKEVNEIECGPHVISSPRERAYLALYKDVDYEKTGSDMTVRFTKMLNQALIRAELRYTDGSVKTEYLKIKTASDYSCDYYSLYRMTVSR